MDAAVYGLVSAFGVAAWVGFSAMAFAPISAWPWLLPVVAAIFVATLIAFIWFFTPIYPLLEVELPLPEGATAAESRAVKQLRSLAGGGHLGAVVLAALYPCLLVASAVSGALVGETSASLLLLAVVSFTVVALWGSRIVSRLPLVTPIWARRLGRGGDDMRSSEAAPRTHGMNAAAPVLVAAAVLFGFVAPMPVGLVLANARDIDAYGRWQSFESGDSVQLANGVELAVPEGWRGSVRTGDPLDAQMGIKERAILTPGDYTIDGAIHVEVLEATGTTRTPNPARLAASARESTGTTTPREVYGPSVVEYAGWTGTAAVTNDDLAMRTRGILKYTVWVRLRAPAGAELFISADNELLGSNQVSDPELLARQVIDLLEIRMSED